MSRSLSSPCLLALALVCAFVPTLRAQIDVKMEIQRHFYLSYEPIVATISITNNTGHDLTLQDQAPEKWFSFEVMTDATTPIPPRAMDYKLPPLTIPMGETVKRKMNLVSLYPVTDYGTYHARAVVYFAAMDKYFASKGVGFEVTEGTSLWKETVGIPEGQQNAGQYRQYELLSFQQPKDNMLYVRIEDKDAGIVYATYPIGAMISGYQPEEQVDALSQLHVLLMTAPKQYTYTRLGPNGEVLGQDDYTDLKTRPRLKRLANGDVSVGGGLEVIQKTAAETAAANAAGPKLSDRPAGMPAQ